MVGIWWFLVVVAIAKAQADAPSNENNELGDKDENLGTKNMLFLTCVAGTTWENDCNYCTCVNGYAYCTMMGCVHSANSHEATLHGYFKNDRVFRHCEKDGAKWREGCNDCICYKGHTFCTKMRCITDPQGNRRKKNYLENILLGCKEESQWNIDCNYCICLSGYAFCTKKFCTVNENYCADGQNLPTKHSCNKCKCINNEIRCTNFICEEKGLASQRSIRCQNGSISSVGTCNNCVCLDGLEYCTVRTCRNSHSNMLIKPDQCIEGQITKLDKCNYCVCKGSQLWCSREDCSRRYIDNRAFKRYCRKGKKIKMDCNSCFCNKGKYICTVKKCLEKAPLQLKDGKCKDGEMYEPEYTSYCNRNVCICLNGAFMCTNQECDDTRI